MTDQSRRGSRAVDRTRTYWYRCLRCGLVHENRPERCRRCGYGSFARFQRWRR